LCTREQQQIKWHSESPVKVRCYNNVTQQRWILLQTPGESNMKALVVCAWHCIRTINCCHTSLWRYKTCRIGCVCSRKHACNTLLPWYHETEQQACHSPETRRTERWVTGHHDETPRNEHGGQLAHWERHRSRKSSYHM
jgi:hypothetical protein